MSSQISITLKAYDEASKTIAEASGRIKGDLAEVEAASGRVQQKQEEVAKSSKGLVTGFSGVATAGFSLYNAYDRVADMQVSVDRANLATKRSADSLEKAQKDYDKALQGTGVDAKQLASAQKNLESANLRVKTTQDAAADAQAKYNRALASGDTVKVADAQRNLSIAQDRVKIASSDAAGAQEKLNIILQSGGVDAEAVSEALDRLKIAKEADAVATERAEMLQGNMNEAMVQSALQVIPISITMVDSLGKAWKNFPDVTGVFKRVSDSVSNVGVSAKTAALGVAAFMGGFLVADTILGAIPEDMRAIAGALTATIAAIVAATIAWMAFHGTMTVGVAVPIILAAVGVGIAGVKAAVGMAEGGLVTKPTVALIGEAGPEIVIPLARFSEVVEESVNATVGKTVKRSSFTEDIPHFAGGGIVEAANVGSCW